MKAFVHSSDSMHLVYLKIETKSSTSPSPVIEPCSITTVTRDAIRQRYDKRAEHICKPGVNHMTLSDPRSEPSSGAAPFLSHPPRGFQASCVRYGWPYRRTQPMGSICQLQSARRRAPRHGPGGKRRCGDKLRISRFKRARGCVSLGLNLVIGLPCYALAENGVVA